MSDPTTSALRRGETRAPGNDLIATGSVGGKIVVVGTGFGPSGTLKVNGVQVDTTEWSTTRIVGKMPDGARSGEVVVHVDDVTTKRGTITL